MIFIQFANRFYIDFYIKYFFLGIFVNFIVAFNSFNKGRGPIRPQIGPSYFFRRIALETIQIDRSQHGEHFGAIFDILS